MGADFDVSFNQNGQPQLLYIDKGKKKTNVGNKLSDFIIQKELGKGNFGSVSLVLSKLTNKVYAMKEIKSNRYKNEEQKLKVEKEIKLLENMNHPNVITYFSSFSENGNFYIILEYINGGSLEDLKKRAQKEGKVLTEEKVWDFLVQILAGLMYLHENKKIIHRDIKPDNILFDKEGNIKITDFGISAVNKVGVDDIIGFHNTCIGPLQYMAPEVVNGGSYTFKSDIYMLGLTFFNIMSGQLPEKKIVTNNDVLIALNPNASISDYYSKDIKYFLTKLLTVDVNERPSTKMAFIEAISFYHVKYLKVTSILSVLQCLYSIPMLASYFQSDNVKEYITNDGESRKFEITKTVKKALTHLDPTNFDYEEVRNQCLKLRILFYVKDEKLRRTREVDIVTVIEDICNNLHKELNRKCLIYIHPRPGINNINDESSQNNGEETIDESDETTVLESACKKFQENFRTKISNLIYFLVKTTYECPECNYKIKFTTLTHCAYCLRPERAAYRLDKKNLTVNDLFTHSYLRRIFDDMNLNCKICCKNQNSVIVSKLFYTCPLNLILAMEYSNGDKFILQIDEYIDISNFVERKDVNGTRYRLIVAIFSEKKDDITKYVLYTRDIIDGNWRYFNGRTYENSNLNALQNHKGIKALVYTAI